MEEFETGDPNRLSAVGVALLSQNDGFLTMIGALAFLRSFS